MDSRENEEFDARLREAYSESLTEASVVNRAVLKEITARRSRVWMGLAAAAVVLTVAGYALIHRGNGEYAELARDHRREVRERQARRWRTEPAEVLPLIARYGVTGAMVAGFAPEGYKLEHAKTCALAGKPVLHLVYTNGLQEISVYVRKQEGTETRPVAYRIDSEQVAAFHKHGFDGVVVTDGFGPECLEWARRAAGIL